MRKTTLVVLSLSFLLGLDVYSGGELSDNQKAIDVTHYYINLKVDPSRKIILGKVEITFLLEEQPKNFEFDLIDSLNPSSRLNCTKKSIDARYLLINLFIIGRYCLMILVLIPKYL